MGNRKLFLSFSGVMHQIGTSVPVEDLHSGLFAMSVTRILALGVPPQRALEGIATAHDQFYHGVAELLVDVVRPALVRAEREGRVVWRPKDGEMSIALIDALLTRNGIHAVRPRTAREQEQYGMVSAHYGEDPNVAEAYANYPLVCVY